MTSLSMLVQEWRFQPLAVAALLLLTVVYVRGWLRVRQVQPGLANWRRLIAFALGMAMVAAVFISPLFAWSAYLLAARTAQKILLSMMAAPLIWLACPIHMMVWGLPGHLRRGLNRAFLRPGPVRRFTMAVTQPLFAWLLFLSLFLLWHDPRWLDWSIRRPWAHELGLWLLLGGALLYWWNVLETTPRLKPETSGWLIAVYLLLVEIPNMAAGISIAFSSSPIYGYYESMQSALGRPGRLSVLEDQMLSGAMIWVIGSLVYISSLVLVVGKLFARAGAAGAPSGFGQDYAGRALAPGLEHRQVEEDWQPVPWE